MKHSRFTKNRSHVLITLMLIMLAVGSTIVYTIIQKEQSTLGVVTRHIALGAWTEGLYDPTSQKLHPEYLQQYEELTKKKVTIAHYYRGWEALSDPILVSEFEMLRSNGWTPMLSSNPYFFSDCPAIADSRRAYPLGKNY